MENFRFYTDEQVNKLQIYIEENVIKNAVNKEILAQNIALRLEKSKEK